MRLWGLWATLCLFLLLPATSQSARRNSNDEPAKISETQNHRERSVKVACEIVMTFANGKKAWLTPSAHLFYDGKQLLNVKTKVLNFFIDQTEYDKVHFSEIIWGDTATGKPNTIIQSVSEPEAVLIRTTDAFVAINEAGDIKRIILAKEKMMPAIRQVKDNSRAFYPNYTVNYVRWKSEEFMLLRILRPSSTPREADLAQTYLLRSSDLNELDLGMNVPISGEVNLAAGKLRISGWPTEVDLSKWDESLKKNLSETIPLIDPPVKDFEGKPTRALKLLEGALRPYTSSELEAAYEFEDTADLEAMRRTFSSRLSKSLVLVGEPGSGKTESVRTFVRNVGRGLYPEISKATLFYRIDAASLMSGTVYTSQAETKINALLALLEANPHIVLIIDEIHTLRGAGTHKDNANDVFSWLRERLRGDHPIQIIGTSNDANYDMAFGGDTALVSRLPRHNTLVPSEKEALRRLKDWMRRSNAAESTDLLLQRLMQVSSDFDVVGVQPFPAIRLADYLLATKRMEGTLNQALTWQDIDRAAQGLYGAHPSQLDAAARKQLLQNYRSALDNKFFGLNDMKDRSLSLSKRALTGVTEGNKPRMRYLISGSPGLAKTDFALAQAEVLNLPSKRIDMSSYQNGPTAVTELYRVIGQALRKNAFTVLVFDEIEKGCVEAQNALLNLLYSEYIDVPESLTGNKGGYETRVRVRTTNCSVVMTTNAGEKYLESVFEKAAGRKGSMVFNEQKSGEQISDLYDAKEHRLAMEADKLSPKLLDRFQEILPVFPPKTVEEFEGVLRLKLSGHLANVAKRQGVSLEVSNAEDLIRRLAVQHFKEDLSYRPAIANLERTVGEVLADAIIDGTIQPGSCEKKLFEMPLPK